MKYLLDTHAFIWYLESNPKLSRKAKIVLENANNQCFVSMASLWEIAVKIALDRLELKIGFEKLKDLISLPGFEILLIQFQHLKIITQLPFHHNDPFDRILVAQAQIEELVFITKDEKIKAYELEILW